MNKRWLMLLIPASMFGGMMSCKKKGCMDPDATNYSEEAKKDDESCTYTPSIKLNGSATINVNLGDTYEDQGATATNKDGSSVNVVIDDASDEVNTSVAGTYTIIYKATNDYGTSSVSRTVNVVISSDNWVGNWALTSQCSATQFPLNDSPVITQGSNGSDLEFEDMFDYLGVIFGGATAIVDGADITVPQQTYSNNGVTIVFSGTGTMNETGTVATITYDYDNTTPLIGGDPGTCTATYEKQ